jgi:hypothetical protein
VGREGGREEGRAGRREEEVMREGYVFSIILFYYLFIESIY